MDPWTAALTLANTVAQIILLDMQHMPEAEWAKRSDLRMKQLEGVLNIVERVREHFQPKQP